MLLSGEVLLADIIRQRFPSLKHIAVTPQLKISAQLYSTLSLVSQDLPYHGKLNDRYQAKDETLWRGGVAMRWTIYGQLGLKSFFDPLPQAFAHQRCRATIKKRRCRGRDICLCRICQ